MIETQINEIEKNTVGTIEIKYYRPKFVHRVLANLIDLILFILVFLGLFIFVRYEFMKGPSLKTTISNLDNLKLESGMYVERDGTLVDVVSYINSSNTLTVEGKIKIQEKSIDRALNFIYQYRTEAEYEAVVELYEKEQLSMTVDGNHMFVVNDEGNIIKIIDAPEGQYEDEKEYFYTRTFTYVAFYSSQIDSRFQGYFATTPVIYDLTKKLNNYLIFVELPIALISAVILVYFVPTLCFRRQRYTLGKALYRIGTVNSNYLSVSFWRNLAKWTIFLLEVILGIISIGILFICSFSLMAFSKKKQGFPDYMLGLQEIDCSKNKIYKSYVEIELDKAQTNKKPNDFKLIDNP